MKRAVGISIFVLAFLLLAYLLGPTPAEPAYDTTPIVVPELEKLDAFIQRKEAHYTLRPNNQAKILWADSIPAQTDYAFLYLHGFSASEYEGYPVNRNIPKQFGANAYLARLFAHGEIAKSPMEDFTVDRYWRSAVEALFVAQKLGKKVIVMGTSTGATLAYSLAAKFPNQVQALILLSPNVQIKDGSAFLLNDPWGLQIAKAVFKGDYRRIQHPQAAAPQYWDTIYHLNAIVQLEELLESSMTEETFAAVHQPTLTLYYYKSESEQDQVVDVSVLPEVHAQLGTPEAQKRIMALSTPGDHVIGSSIKSHDWQVVQDEIARFLVEVMGMSPIRD